MAEYLTVKEAAALLNVSEKTLRKAMDEDRIPYIELGPKAIRIPVEGLRELWDDPEREAS